MISRLIEQAREQATWDIPENTEILLLKMADVLEEQVTARKVKYLNRHGEGYDRYNDDNFSCPNCGRKLRNKQKDPYCPRCGQLLDWKVT